MSFAEIFTFHNSLQVTAKPWSLWKTFLVCLLACLIATTLVVLVLYFVHFGKPTDSNTIIIHADGKSNHVTCIPGSTPSPASSTLPGSPTPVPNQSSSAKASPSSMETTKTTTLEHEIIIEDQKWHFWALSTPPARSTPSPRRRHVQVSSLPCQEVGKHLASWELALCAPIICCIPIW